MRPLRIRWQQLGAHVHARFFVGEEGYAALAGTLIFNEREWEQLSDRFTQAGFVLIAETCEPGSQR
jgi:hypothetical protein